MKTVNRFSFSRILKLACYLLVFFYCVQTANSQPVTLDPTFGENGSLRIPISGIVQRVNFDLKGNIFALGSSEIAGGVPIIVKTNTDGEIDNSFGINGITSLEISSLGVFDFKITNENKIIFVGGNPLCIIQLNEDGSLDYSFGNNGKIVIPTVYDLIVSVNIENADFLLIGDGNIILKCNYNGEIDHDFGIDGKVYLEDDESQFMPACIKILNDKSILVAGCDDSPFSNTQSVVCKVNPDGSFVTNFANNGIWKKNRTSVFGNEFFINVIEEQNKNILLVGYANSIFMCCLYPDGIVNNSFGENGFSFFDELQQFPMFCKSFLQNDNKYLIGNYSKIININDNGSLNTNFNHTGMFVCENYLFFDMKLKGFDKLVLGGTNDEFLLIRLNIPYEVSVRDIPNTENRISIFPNPTKDYLYFSDEMKFEIIDLQGRILLKSEKVVPMVNVSYLETGIYFAKFEDGRVEKFVKE